jgi:hypothetical protein
VTLAYVFWHWPAWPEGYEDRIRRFHEALARPGAVTFRLERPPFADESGAYEDWYPVDGWAAIGELNDHAITGARKAPHDEVAEASRKGAGAIFRRIDGDLPLAEVRFAAWTPQRPAAISGDAAVWQRQLVLGPAPEYAVLAPSEVAVPEDAIRTSPALVARS